MSIYQPASGACFFAIGRGDRELPFDQLIDLKYAKGLDLVLPYNAVNIRMLQILKRIEIARLSKDRASNLSIEVVGDVGREAVTGETKYSLITYGSVMALKDEIKGRLNKESIKYLRGVLEMKLKGYPWQTTLRETN